MRMSDIYGKIDAHKNRIKNYHKMVRQNKIDFRRGLINKIPYIEPVEEDQFYSYLSYEELIFLGNTSHKIDLHIEMMKPLRRTKKKINNLDALWQMEQETDG